MVEPVNAGQTRIFRSRANPAKSAIPVVAAIGMIATTLLIESHFGSEVGSSILRSICGAEGSGCDAANRSALSEVLGLPLATWGFVFYGVVFVLGVVARLEDQALALRWALRLALIGAALDAFLLGYSVVELRTLCLVCGVTYGVTGVLVALARVATRRSGLTWRAALLSGPGSGARDGAPRLLTVFGLVAVGATAALITVSARARAEAAATTPEKALERAWSVFLASYRATPPVALEPEPGRSKGGAEPLLSLVIFSDFQCPPCRRAAGTLGRFADRLQPYVRLTLKHYPLDTACNPGVTRQIHPAAGELARAAEAAGRLGAFWPFHDRLFANQERFESSVSPGHLAFLAREAGLDPVRFLEELPSAAVADAVRRDIELGNRLGVRGTPTLFANGRRLDLIPPEEFLERLLREEATALASTSPTLNAGRLRRSRAHRSNVQEGSEIK